MLPIQELLNRIRWDREFGKGEFEIGYDDHVRGKIVRVPFRTIIFEEGDAFTFHPQDPAEGESNIPLHRVREVYKNGSLIWRRPDSGKP